MRKIIGIRLEEERERLNKNKGEMAVIGGVAGSAYTNYSEGKRAPDAEFLAAIAAAGADVNYILTGEPHPSLSLHERLAGLRHERQLTQEQAAEKLELPKADWIALERGKLPVGRELLAKLSTQGWDLAYLLVGIRQGMMAAGEPLKWREAGLLDKLKHATDSDWAAIEHLANLIAR